MESYKLFSETTKLVDLVKANYRLLDVLPRFGVGLGFQERTVKQICEERGISPSVFLLVCNVYAFDDYLPNKQVFMDIPTLELLDFLSASHKDFLQTQTNIFDRVVELAEIGPDLHRKVIVDLCTQYRRLLREHIDNEERVEFPYIRELIGTKSPKSMSRPQQFEPDGELYVAFSDFQNLIMKYLTDDSVATSRLYRNVLVDTALFYTDTDKHILLEDMFARAMERKINYRT